MSIAALETVYISTLAHPSRTWTACRWALMVPAAVAATFTFSIVMGYMIDHAPDEMYSLPGTASLAKILLSLFAGGVWVAAAAYVAPSHRSTVAIVAASVLATALIIAILLLRDRIGVLQLMQLPACIGGMIFSAVKVNVAERGGRGARHRLA